NVFSEKFYSRVIKLSAKNSVDSVRMDMIAGMKIFFPSYLEQQKIASFLSLIDKRIQTQSKILLRYQTLIRNLRDKIFEQELRFKNEHGKHFSAWQTKKLKDVAKIFDGTHQTPKYVDNGVPFYSVENVTANNFNDTKFISEEAFQKENKRVIVEKGDILMTRIGDIGSIRFIDWNVCASFYVSLALIERSKEYN